MMARVTARIVAARRVHTMTGPPVTALAAVGERVVALGELAGLRDRFPGAEVVDLGDAVVVPGLSDAHMHPSMSAEDLLHVDLSPGVVRTEDELRRALADAAAATPAGAWVRASRYDHTKTTGGRVLDRADLDAVTTDHPVLVVHVAAHWGVTNTAGLAAGGITDDTPDPAGGSYGRDGAGRLTGVLYEQALSDYANPSLATGPTVVPASSQADRRRGLARFLTTVHAAGLTSVGDAMAGPDEVALFTAADRAGELTARVDLLLTAAHHAKLGALGIGTGWGSDRLRFAGVKAFVDGAVAGGTCLLEEPFEGTDDHGTQVTSYDDLAATVLAVHRAGDRVAVHANGDRAIALVLDAVEAAAAAHPRTDARHRIEHCTVVTPAILDRMARLGMVAVPFGSYVAFHGEKLLGWYGAQRLERMFAHRSLLDAGVAVAGSSDYPCGPLEPLLAMQSCVTRTSADGTVLGGSQRITPYDALALYTTGAAWAAGVERDRGRLAPGFLADLTVLGEDPLEVDPHDLAAIPVHSTWVGGRQVWSA